jgi:hypothetical protein
LTRTRQPELSAVAPLAQELSDRRSVEKEVQRVDLGAVAEVIRSILQAGGELSKRQLRLAPWCLWGTVPTLADDDELVAALLSQIDSTASARLFRTLATAYATSFSMNLASRESVAAALSTMASRFQGGWSELQANFSIFDRENPTRKLAERVIERQVSPGRCLREQGFGYDIAGSGLVRAVLDDALIELSERDVRDPLDHLAFVRQIALDEAGQPLFDGLGHSLLSALLAPLEGRAVGDEVQDRYLDTILPIFGDPRLHPGKWVNLPHKELLFGWLGRQSLRQFLDIVDQTAVESMFRYRRAFWEKVYDLLRSEGRPVEAWVAFGPRGARLARNHFGQNVKFARLYTNGKQVEDGHAVLIFKVEDCVIADWSHNGRCNIWADAEWRGAPKLYRARYGSDEVRIASSADVDTRELFAVAHTSSQSYNWQGKVAERLRKRLGIQIPQSVYRVR